MLRAARDRYITAAVAVAATLFSASARAQFDLTPTAVGEGDYRRFSADGEGESGFALARIILGVRTELPLDLSASLSVEYVRGETPSLFDAYAAWKPVAGFELRVGYGATPLFATARDEYIETLAIPELSMVTRALWPGRNFGIEAHYAPPKTPLEAWLRVGSPSPSPTENDTSAPSLDARVDLAFGRLRAGGSAASWFGLRVGTGLRIDEAAEHAGVEGTGPSSFAFWRPPTVDGLRVVGEGHVALALGPVLIRAEGGAADESRDKSLSGDPTQPKQPLPSTLAYGANVELSWMLTGDHRTPGVWPGTGGHRFGAVEVAARVERLTLGEGASDVKAGGATAAQVAVRWWIPAHIALGFAAYLAEYDTAPLETPNDTFSWTLIARATISLH